MSNYDPPQDPSGEQPQQPDPTQPPPPPPPSQPEGYGQPAAPNYGQPAYGQPSYGEVPPPPGYGAGGVGGAEPFSVGNAFSYGWSKFQANIGPIILLTLAILAVSIIIQLISSAFTSGLGGQVTTEFNPDTGQFETSGGGFFGLAFFVSLLFSMVSYVVTLLIQAAITKGALDLTHGRKIDLGSMFNGLNIPQIVIAAIIVGAATFIGLVLCFLPGLVVMFFTSFTMYFLIDKNLPAMDAIKASVAFVRENAGTLLVFFLACLAAYFVGALLCGIGLLVAIPVVIIAQAYTYRTLQGEVAV